MKAWLAAVGKNKDSDQISTPSRRDAVRAGLAAVAGIQIVALAGHQAWAGPGKLAKSAVKYVDVSADEGKYCDDCIQFVPGRAANEPGSCKVVEGDINPHGHCLAFSPKSRR
jgi:hypothetical protein